MKGEVGTVIESLAAAENTGKETTGARDVAAIRFAAPEKDMETRMDALQDVRSIWADKQPALKILDDGSQQAG